MSKIVCFGEIMGRLCPEGNLKIVQASKLELTYAGGEANVAVSLANYDQDVAYISKLPENDLGKAVIRSLRSYNVDISNMVYGGERLGMYYVEKGASQRPSKVIYDRKYSSIAMAKSEDFDWEKIFNGTQWFHFTGISPALSDNMVQICLEACQTAKQMGIKISCDLNYRKNLWSSQKACKVMSELIKYVDVCIANEEDAQKVFGISSQDTDVDGGKINKAGYINVAKQIQEKFGCKTVAITLRESISASDNGWSAMLYNDGKSYFSKRYMMHLVDRVGGGDSFVGGLLYGLVNEHDMQDSLEFAVAASCLKHSIQGDFNQVSIEDVMSLVKGDGSGRVQR